MEDLGLNLRGRVAVVTGGSRGIGRAVVERLAEAGVKVSINYLRDESAAAEAVRIAESYGVETIAVRGDVSSVKESEFVIRKTVSKFGRIDMLVCNAGVWEGAPVDEMDEKLWGRVLDINLKGTWAICRAAVPLLKKQGGGRIVAVSSTAGQRGEGNYSSYAASKGGQISFVKSLAVELAPYHINVNAVAPGWVSTEMSEDVLSDPNTLNSIRATVPQGRAATADEIARPIVFLCSDWASHITGEVLNINGGSVLCG